MREKWPRSSRASLSVELMGAGSLCGSLVLISESSCVMGFFFLCRTIDSCEADDFGALILGYIGADPCFRRGSGTITPSGAEEEDDEDEVSRDEEELDGEEALNG
jgi:hypothetical protein